MHRPFHQQQQKKQESVPLGVDRFPCEILRLNLPRDCGGELHIALSALLCAPDTVEIHFEGKHFGWYFYPQKKLSGACDVFLKGVGVSRIDLKPGETVSFPYECLVAFGKGVRYGKCW